MIAKRRNYGLLVLELFTWWSRKNKKNSIEDHQQTFVIIGFSTLQSKYIMYIAAQTKMINYRKSVDGAPTASYKNIHEKALSIRQIFQQKCAMLVGFEYILIHVSQTRMISVSIRLHNYSNILF